MNIDSKFKLGKNNKTFLRVDSEHKLDIFLGYNNDSKATMTILNFGNLKKVESSKFIKVVIGKQVDNKISLSFILKDNEMYDIFIKFCEDIIESSRFIEEKFVIDFIIDRWNVWKNIFKNINTEGLDENKIIGLLGELIFLSEYMIPKYGLEEAINAWQGPEMLHKDFEIKDTWYEVKTKSTASLTVKISSIEQLDSNYDGNLVVIKLDKTNKENAKAINLNEYIEKIQKNIKSYDLRIQMINKLSYVGYSYKDIYNELNFSFEGLTIYEVDKNFPCLRKKDLKEGIVKAIYEIDILSIKAFQKRM